MASVTLFHNQELRRILALPINSQEDDQDQYPPHLRLLVIRWTEIISEDAEELVF